LDLVEENVQLASDHACQISGRVGPLSVGCVALAAEGPAPTRTTRT
jgi:hypothetical protein